MRNKGVRVQIPLPLHSLPSSYHVILVNLLTILLRSTSSLMSLYYIFHTIKIMFSNLNNFFHEKNKKALNQCTKIIQAHRTQCFIFKHSLLTMRFYNNTTPIIYLTLLKLIKAARQISDAPLQFIRWA